MKAKFSIYNFNIHWHLYLFNFYFSYKYVKIHIYQHIFFDKIKIEDTNKLKLVNCEVYIMKEMSELFWEKTEKIEVSLI